MLIRLPFKNLKINIIDDLKYEINSLVPHEHVYNVNLLYHDQTTGILFSM